MRSEAGYRKHYSHSDQNERLATRAGVLLSFVRVVVNADASACAMHVYPCICFAAGLVLMLRMMWVLKLLCVGFGR